MGRYGILAPAETLIGEVLGPQDAVLVPGVAFDLEGHRLGRGEGWYDRSFPVGQGGACLVGATFESRLMRTLPYGSRDRDMDAIVTEAGLHWIQGGA